MGTDGDIKEKSATWLNSFYSAHKEFIYLATFTVQLISIGFYLVYYYSFGVNFTQYISLSEILVNGFIYLVSTLFLAGSSLLISQAIYWSMLNLINLSMTASIKLDAKKIARLLNVMLFVALAVLIRFYYGYYFFEFAMLFLAIAMYNNFFILDRSRDNEEDLRIFFFFLIFILFFTSCLLGYSKAHAIKNGGQTLVVSEVSFRYNEKQYSNKSNGDCSVIGESKDYIFMYNNKIKKTEIIPRSQVKNYQTRLFLEISKSSRKSKQQFINPAK